MKRAELEKLCHGGVHWSLMLLCLFPLLPLRMAVFASIPLGVFSMAHWFISEEKAFSREATLTFLAFAALPMLYLTELVSTENPSYVWREVQRKMGLLIFPFLFLLNRSAGFRFRLPSYMNVFTSAVVLLALYTCGKLWLEGLNPEYLNSGGLAFAVRTTIGDMGGIHPTYFGLMLSFGIAWLVHSVMDRPNSLDIAGYVKLGLALALVGFLAFLGARMVIGALLIALVWMYWKHKAPVGQKVLVTAVSIGILVLVGLLVPTLNERLMELFNSEPNSTNVREMVYSCSWSIVRDEWLLGVGIEKLQYLLNTCYTQFTAVSGQTYFSYNTHNEFLNVLCGKGIIGLILLLGLITRLVFGTKGNRLMQALLIIFVLTCLTENLLERQLGVYLLAVVIGMFVIHTRSSTE